VAAKSFFLKPPSKDLSSRSGHRPIGGGCPNSRVHVARSSFRDMPARRSISAATASGVKD
jgi:hypothetical protein